MIRDVRHSWQLSPPVESCVGRIHRPAAAPNTTPPPVSALSQIGGTVGVETGPSTNSLTFQSIVAGTGLGAQKPAINAGTQPYLSTTSSTISSLSSGFTIQETLAVTLNVKLDQINYSSAMTLTSVPVPEPLTMAIAGLGALDMIGDGLRRRKVLGA
jgi:PEP-CTERM motif